jgi:triacylglycerol lipase
MKSHKTNTLQRHVVFVHGIFNTGRLFVFFSQDAAKHGFIPHAPSLRRADGRATMLELAEQVREYIETQIPPDAEVHLVGFSMGGVVARVYAQMLGGSERVRSLTAIASPHEGSLWAYLNPFRGTRDLQPRSKILRALRETEQILAHLPLLAMHTPLDTMIVPYTSAIWARAENKRFWVQFHPFMAFSPRIRAAVWAFLESVDVREELKKVEREQTSTTTWIHTKTYRESHD